MPNADDLIPPEWLASLAGPGPFVDVGRDFARGLVELCGLGADDHLLDVGCGSGRVAAALTEVLSSKGRYEGLDVLPWAIEWCEREIGSRHPNFSFQHADVASGQYHPDGAVPPEDYSLPFDGDRFDVICATSLFTHMLADGLVRYLSEFARVLKPGGRALMTFYLLNDESSRLIEAGRPDAQFRFGHSIGQCRVTYEDAPEYVVAYDEEFVLEGCRRAGLRVREPVTYGEWCGREQFLSWQDIVVAERVGPAA